MKSIYLNDFQLHSNSADINIWIEPPIEGLESPAIRSSSYDRSGEHGGVMNNVLYGARLITLNGRIASNTLAAFEQKRRALESATRITRDSSGLAEGKTLYLTTMDDLQLQTMVYLQTSLKMAIETPLSAKFQLQLYAPDFALDSQTLQSASLGRYGGGGFILPVIAPIVSTVGTGGTGSVTNGGTVESYPILRFNGQLTNPRLTNTTTGETILLEMTIASGEQVVVDMKNRTIVQGGVTNRISKKSSDSDFWSLETGVNYLQLTTSDSGDAGTVTVEHRSAYLGL
jgi:hypothetical protein